MEPEKSKDALVEGTQEKTVGVFYSHENAKMPTRAYANDVGYDLYALDSVEIPTGTVVEVRTGIHLSMPSDTFAQINIRSSYGKKGLYIHHGVIDPGYTGELTLWVMNIAGVVEPSGLIKKEMHTISQGDKVAQILFHKAITPVLKEITHLPETERGDKGHGSSGN